MIEQSIRFITYLKELADLGIEVQMEEMFRMSQSDEMPELEGNQSQTQTESAQENEFTAE
jgi:hypothetical protein